MAQTAAEKETDKKEYAAEYVGGGNPYFGAQTWNGLADSYQPNLTSREIERARRDDEISSSVEFLGDSIFSDGLQTFPAVEADDEEFETAQEIADFCSDAIDAADKDVLMTLREQFRAAFYHGLKVGEIVLRYENEGKFDNKLVIDRINLKPLDATAFYTDEFYNVLGLIAAQDARKRLNANNITTEELIPREKFLIQSFEHDDNDPRGLTQIKAAYEALCDKRLTRSQYKEWRRTSAIPKKVGITEPNARDIQERDKNTGQPVMVNNVPKVKSPQTAMLGAIAEMANDSAIALPNGADLKQLEVFGTGEQFDRSFKINNSAIRKSILGDALATGAADKDARAARQSSMNVVDLRVKWFRNAVCVCFKRDVLTLLVKANYDRKFWHLVPECSLGDTERRDWATDTSAASRIGYRITKNHAAELDKQFGLKPREEGDEEMSGNQNLNGGGNENDSENLDEGDGE